MKVTMLQFQRVTAPGESIYYICLCIGICVVAPLMHATPMRVKNPTL